MHKRGEHRRLVRGHLGHFQVDSALDSHVHAKYSNNREAVSVKDRFEPADPAQTRAEIHEDDLTPEFGVYPIKSTLHDCFDYQDRLFARRHGHAQLLHVQV